MYFYYNNAFLLLICSLLVSIDYTNSSSSGSPSQNAYNIFLKMRAQPTVVQHVAELVIQTSARSKRQNLIDTLERYCTPELSNSEQGKFQIVLESIRYMEADGDIKFITFALGDENKSKVKFLSVAARMDPKGELLDYALASYAYQTPSRVHHETAHWIDFFGIQSWKYQKKIVDPNLPIDAMTRAQLEASFLLELERRALITVDQNGSIQLQLTIDGESEGKKTKTEL